MHASGMCGTDSMAQDCAPMAQAWLVVPCGDGASQGVPRVRGLRAARVAPVCLSPYTGWPATITMV